MGRVTNAAVLGRLLRPAGPVPRPSRRELIFDAVLTIGIALVAIQPSYGEHPIRAVDDTTPPEIPPAPAYSGGALAQHHVAWAVAMLLLAAPLVLRRRYPLAVLWTVMGTATVVAALTDDRATLRFSFYVCVLAAYTAAVYSPYRLPALASQAAAALLFSRILSSALSSTVSNDAVPFLVLVPIAVATDGLRRWRRRADEERARTAAAAERERTRLAQELHDVVTHNVSMMVIQAGAARSVLGDDHGPAGEAMLAVEAAGRAAMSELRQVMGLLTMNADGAEPAGLDRLDAMIAGVRAGGVEVRLEVTGRARPLPAEIELAAYRVVQEALTNAVKHAAGGAATVVVGYGAGHLDVAVVNTGGTRRGPAAAGSGRGLIGLRERLAAHGGTVEAGPRAGGGFRVHARIPLAGRDPAARLR